MRTWLKSIRESVSARDVFVFGGLGMLCAGAGMIFVPAAPIIAGIAFLIIGLIGVPKWG